MSNKTDYDVIIIGAGIGGLVCGCYLAKAGMKTLIVEKNAMAGGYCTSFKIKGFSFDACAHGLGSLRTGGRVTKIINDLDLKDKLKIIRHNPSDTVITPEHKIKLFNSLDGTIREFQKCFPEEKEGIESFFKFIAFSDTATLVRLRSQTFKELLNQYLKDEAVKNILSVFILGLVGLPSWRVSAVVASLITREFVLDGGYYPVGGMQAFPNALVEKVKHLDGDIIFSQSVRSIIIDKERATGIRLENGKKIISKYVVSACDLRQTYFKLIEDKLIPSLVRNKIRLLKPSSSAFLVYLGVKKDYSYIPELKAPIWIMNNNNFKKMYSSVENFKNECLLITASFTEKDSSCKHGATSIRLESSTFYKTKSFWNKRQREELGRIFIKMAEQVIPDLSKNIVFKSDATPVSLYNWTRNHKGSSYGWESTPEQFGDPDISQKTPIKGLYLAGHWSNQSSGIAFVANCGYDTAKLILREEK